MTEPALAPRLPDGASFGRHRIESLIAFGGMGVVYRAVDTFLGRTVALKLIHPHHAGDEEFRRRFQREASAAAAIEHPNVLPVHHAGECDGWLYLDLRFVDGADLRTLIRREGRVAPERAVELIAQVAGALDTAHEIGLVHRDVKPANVLVERRPHGEHAYLADFGLAKLVDDVETRLTRVGHWMGTPGYAAPEQIRGEPLDGRADVYALGAMLHHALTGRAPATWTPERGSRVQGARSLVPELPKRLDAALAKALADAPAKRFTCAGELAEAARAALERAAPRVPDAAPPDSGRYTRAGRAVVGAGLTAVRRRWKRRIVTIALPLAVAAAVPVTVARIHSSPPPGASSIAGRMSTHSFSLGTQVLDATVAGGVLTAVSDSGEVLQFGLDGRRRHTWQVDPSFTRVATGRAGTWIASTDGKVRRLDAHGTGPVTQADAAASDIAVTDLAVWVLNGEGQRVTRSIEDGQTVTDVAAAAAIAADDAAVWLLQRDGYLTELGAGGAPVRGGFPTGTVHPDDLALGDGSAWILDRKQGRVMRVSLSGGTPTVAADDLGADVRAIAYADGTLWIIHADGSVAEQPVRA